MQLQVALLRPTYSVDHPFFCLSAIGGGAMICGTGGYKNQFHENFWLEFPRGNFPNELLHPAVWNEILISTFCICRVLCNILLINLSRVHFLTQPQTLFASIFDHLQTYRSLQISMSSHWHTTSSLVVSWMYVVGPLNHIQLNEQDTQIQPPTNTTTHKMTRVLSMKKRGSPWLGFRAFKIHTEGQIFSAYFDILCTILCSVECESVFLSISFAQFHLSENPLWMSVFCL